MSGYYIIPSSRDFLSLSGGTVSGLTYFSDTLSASTFYLDTGITENNSLSQILVYNNSTHQIEYRSVSTIGVQNLNTADIIEFDSGTTTISTLYNTVVPDATNSVPVGGAPALPASVWKTYNMVDVLDQILFPTLLPDYTIPTYSLSSSITGTREIGSTISPLLNLIGTKNDAGDFTDLTLTRTFTSTTTVLSAFTSLATATTTNIPAQYGFNDPNNPNLTFSASYTDSYVVPPPPSSYYSSTVYGGNSIYLSGLTKQNNKGNFDTTPYAVRLTTNPQSGSTTLNSNNITIVGIYPFFYGTATTQPTSVDIANEILTGTTNSVLADAQGTISITFNATNVYLWFAHYSVNTTKAKWYVDSLNNGNIGLPSDLFDAPTIQNVTSPSGYWSNIPFKIYISNYPTKTTAPPNTTPVMQMRNT